MSWRPALSGCLADPALPRLADHPATAPEGKRGSGGYLATKVVSVYPSNTGSGFSSHQGVVLLFEAEHGSLQCIADAHAVTAIRTAAASAIATDLLARKDATRLAIIGSGTQARKHLEAVSSVRSISAVRVWSRSAEHAAAFAAECSTDAVPVSVAGSPTEAVADADIVCTVTASSEPLLRGADLKPGAHVNAVGACFPTQRELDTDAVLRARLFVDTKEACLAEPGDLVTPIKEGAMAPEHIVGEIGEVIAGRLEGRQDEGQVTLFKSVGAAVEDLCAAAALFELASAQPAGAFPSL